MIWHLLSQGVSIQEILEEYPDLEVDDIHACLAYARAVIANEKIESLQLEMA